MYYVYEWYVIETNEVIYVGKGTRNRYKVRKHNRLFDDFILNNNCNSRIVKTFEKEEDAFLFEYDYTEKKKEIGQCKCNIIKGGTGGTTEWWTNEKRKQYSANNVMKSEKQRERMSLKNPMKNKNIAMKVGKTKRKGVVIGNKKFDSMNEAMKFYDVTYDTIRLWCDKGISTNGEKCHRENEPQKEYIGRYNKGTSKAICYNGKIYECAVDIANELGVNKTTVGQWAKKGFTPNGIPCKFVNDKRELTYQKTDYGYKNRKPIWVNGVLYPSKRDAEIQLGLSKGYLAPYISGVRKNNKYICEYDNQHPSREKSNNSITEGSTTNE